MKRLSTSDPLTADDVADRLNRALDRALRIMWDVRLNGGELMWERVKMSHYLHASPAGNHLAHELQRWGFEPFPAKGDD